MDLVWGGLVAFLYRVRTGYARGALVLGAGVVSHWVLDWVTHRPDLPLVPWGGPLLGLGLWNSRVGTVAVEGGMFVAGVWLYMGVTRARNAVGTWALAGLVTLLAALYAANAFGSPPPAPGPVVWTDLAAWLVILPWAVWIERNRETRTIS